MILRQAQDEGLLISSPIHSPPTPACAGIDGVWAIVPREGMTATLLAELKHACQTFADQPGQIAVIVQSKPDPALSVSINADLRLPAASVVKPAIACAAADAAHLDLRQPIAISDLEETFYCSIIQAFDPGDKITLKAVIGLMLIVSDNPATTATLDAVGMDTVNQWLETNRLSDTSISVGFDDASLGAPLRANLTTAQDCLRLLQLIDKTPDYAFIKHMLANNLRNERIPKLLPDDAIIAHKTGTLNGLCHDIALIEGPAAAFYLVVLADGLPDGHDFANDIARFSKQIYDVMSLHS